MEPGAVTKFYFLLVVSPFLYAFYLSFLSYLLFVIPIAIIARGYLSSLKHKWHTVCASLLLLRDLFTGGLVYFT